MDANHCPGAVQFLFQLPEGGHRYVHCGDMRFCTAMTESAHLQRFVGPRAVFLDTTYCHPRHIFPPQVDINPSISTLKIMPFLEKNASLSMSCHVNNVLKVAQRQRWCLCLWIRKTAVEI